MKKLTLNRPIVFGLVLIIAATAPLWFPRYYIQLSTQSLILAITAMSFILLAGFGGMTSLAQMSFFMASGYIFGFCVMTRGWPFLPSIILAIIGATALSALFAYIAIRAKGVYYLMITFALSLVAYGIAMQWYQFTRGSEGFSGITRPSVFGISLINPIPMFYVTLIVSVISYLVLNRIVKSTFGVALQGIRDNPVRMASLGYDVQLHRFIANVIAGLFASIAGILGVIFYGGVSPTTTGLWQSILVVMAATVGGVSVIEGGILGAFITVFLGSFASSATQHYMTVVGTIFVLVVIFLPAGFLGSGKKFKKMFEKLTRQKKMDKEVTSE
jgi:branched-chain amino acid transport system permease protein